MNVIPTTTTSPAGAAPSVPAPASPAQDPALDAAQGAAEAASDFAQWLAVGEAPPADATAESPTDAPAPDDTTETPDADAALPADGILLAAMGMPVMAPVPAPVPAAAAADAGDGEVAGVAATGAAQAPHMARTADLPQAALPAQAAAVAEAQQRAAAPARSPSAATAPGQQAPSQADSLASFAAPRTDPAPAPAASAAGAAADTPQRAASVASAAAAAGIPGETGDKTAPASASNWGVGAAAPVGANLRPADTVVLAGPPAAWRQSLHEALGERIGMHSGPGLEQAVIRLEPPNLGRIDIAIRYRGGNLEVSLTATHSEVVRQLHTVSDNLRADLAQRQYSEVAVTVSQAPRAQQSGFNAFAGHEGRGHEQGREHEESHVGTALAEAGNPTSTFTLNGRE